MNNPACKSVIRRAVVIVFAALLIPIERGNAQTPSVIALDQGSDWTADLRIDFYKRNQGARLIPLKWAEALKQSNGKPFLDSSLSRYGYLPNDSATKPGLPIGFTVARGNQFQGGNEVLGITCSACHTRQIQMNGVNYRVDGGPALVDFQAFLIDLDTAVIEVLSHQDKFSDFAKLVLGADAPASDRTQLKLQLAAWHKPYHTLMSKGLPKPPQPGWGLGRLDAVGMILNRVTGLDIGTSPDRIIPENIRTANAPVRYPFLWDAPIQDMTQWPGLTDNGSDLLALARNLGQVYGVFAIYQPKKSLTKLVLNVDYLNNTSVDFDGLESIEKMVKKIGPPKFPLGVDSSLIARGEAVFNRDNPASDYDPQTGGCVSCHGIQPGATRFPNNKTWKTPLQDVGTDSAQYELLGWKASTGVLKGASIPFIRAPLGKEEKSVDILRISVVGSILQHYVPIAFAQSLKSKDDEFRVQSNPFNQDTEQLKGVYVLPADIRSFKYEARVMRGIWAAAPYLHNGSVPTLADLLTRDSARPASFNIGNNYDPDRVGLAKEQPDSPYVMTTTDCSQRNSGNSRCGHNYGVDLSDEDKRALLEYLKTL